MMDISKLLLIKVEFAEAAYTVFSIQQLRISPAVLK